MISRFLSLTKLLDNNRSCFLLGPRGTGKTLLSKQYLEENGTAGHNTLHIDLLSLKQQARYLQNPELFRADIEYQLDTSPKKLIVVLDEVQKATQLLDEVHYFLEKDRDRCQFLLTGSSARKLKRGGANLLAGRAISLSLHPLSLLDKSLNLEHVLQVGSLPRFYLESSGADLLLESYVETYLKEEIQAERLVRSLEPFHRFINVAAQMNGKVVNLSSIAREIKMSDKAVKDYFNILCDTLLVFELPAWSRSVRRQLSQGSKYYLFDCGVLNAILGEQSIQVTPGTRRYGNLFENFIITEFFRQNDYLQTRRKFYSWRLSSGRSEIDLVIDQGIARDPIAIEIKSRTQVEESDLVGLEAFRDEYPNAALYCISRTSTPYILKGIRVLPWEEGITEILRGSVAVID